MAGVVKAFNQESRDRFFDIAEKFSEVGLQEAFDILSNLLSAGIAVAAKDLDQADKIADEFATNVKLLIRANHPEVAGTATPSGATGRVQ
jgi:hypothetical protein